MSVLDKAKKQGAAKVNQETKQQPKIELQEMDALIAQGTDHEATAVVAKDLNDFIAGGIKPPEPPKPGELMHCLYCRKPMPPESFPKSQLTRKYMFKWQICEECIERAHSTMDRNTSGIMRDRS